MAAGKYNFVIEQGATLNLNVQWNDEYDDPIFGGVSCKNAN
jgi:hypothetical protein